MCCCTRCWKGQGWRSADSLIESASWTPAEPGGSRNMSARAQSVFLRSAEGRMACSYCLDQSIVSGRESIAVITVKPHMERLSPSAYEEFIADLIGNLRLRHDITDIKYGPNNRLIGASGVKHQIDVSFIEHMPDAATLVLVECKSLRAGRAINLGHVKILKATADDLESINGATPESVAAHIVSSVPLQSGAARYAQHYRIGAHLVGDQGNWTFKYGSVGQFGLALQSSSAVVTGTASILRRCSACGNQFTAVSNEKLCATCGAERSGVVSFQKK